MNFRSDNVAAAAPEIVAAIAAANGRNVAYCEDELSRALDAAFSEIFETEVRVFTVVSGTAANGVALASLTRPWGGVLCHREAHIEGDECGAAEFYTGGAKLVLMDGPSAKVTPSGLQEALGRHVRGVHSIQASTLSLTQPTERGTVYTPEELRALDEIAARHGLATHMDGARFACAVAALGCAPADITWRAGVDALCFGATKNGALTAEAIVLFDLDRAEEIERRRKRAGHLLSKGWFVAAQLLAYLKDGLWLKLAARSNALAGRLGVQAGRFLSEPVQTNHVFIKPGVAALARLRAAGAQFYDWGPDGAGEARLVVSWDQDERDIEALGKLLAELH